MTNGIKRGGNKKIEVNKMETNEKTMEYEPLYWNKKGKYQTSYEKLGKLIPIKGRSASLMIELLRCATRIYYRHFNDGVDAMSRDNEYAHKFVDLVGGSELVGYLMKDQDYDVMIDKVVEIILKEYEKKTKGE
jgi:hypothetical protein